MNYPGARLSHVGVVVDDLDAAIRFLISRFGCNIREEVRLPGIKASWVSGLGIDIELIEVGDDNQRVRRLAVGETARIDHLAIEVSEIEHAITDLRASGVETTADEAVRVGDTLNFWTRPETTDGVTYQLLARMTGHG